MEEIYFDAVFLVRLVLKKSIVNKDKFEEEDLMEIDIEKFEDSIKIVKLSKKEKKVENGLAKILVKKLFEEFKISGKK